MKPSKEQHRSNNIASWMLVVVGLTIFIITILTITAIWSGPPTV